MSVLNKILQGLTVIVFGVVFLGILSWFRFDMRITSPIAYKVGVKTQWYEAISLNKELLPSDGVLAPIERRLSGEGFVKNGKSHAFNRKDGELKFYMFPVRETDILYVKEFSIASGFCSQTAVVVISSENKKVTNIRGLNPGGTCV